MNHSGIILAIITGLEYHEPEPSLGRGWVLGEFIVGFENFLRNQGVLVEGSGLE